MTEVPTPHLQLQKIRALLNGELKGKLDDVTVTLAKEIYIANMPGLLINAGFELGDFTGWIVESSEYAEIDSEPANAHTGSCCCWVKTARKWIDKLFDVAVDVDRIRSLGIWAKYNAGSENFRIYVYYTDGSFTVQTFTGIAQTYTFCDVAPYLESGKKVKWVRFRQWSTTFDCYVDDMEIDVEPEALLVRGNVLTGQIIVVVAGTPVALGTGILKHSVLVQPIPSNTGNVMIGNSSSQNFVLTPSSQPIRLFAKKLDDIYVDAATNGEGVNYVGG